MGPASEAGPTASPRNTSHFNFRHNSRVRAPGLPIVAAGVLACAVVATRAAQPRAGATRITWEDAAPLRARLEKQGITQAAFPSYVERLRENHASRMRQGDLDHLVFYLLQSRHFTPVPAIEPALSAKGLVGSLDPAERDVFLRSSQVPPARIPPAVRARAAALLRALDSADPDPRVVYFRSLVKAAFPAARTREGEILREYGRVIRFVYEKEFVAQRSANPSVAVAELYRTRGLSTDTAVEAGYVVYNGLGILKSLEPARTIRRVLIVGPGLDLAPRTGLLEEGPPESYQPWAVMDALLALGLSSAGDLEIVGADINPRVVQHLRRAHANPPALTLVSGIRESETVALSNEYRDYFARLGKAIGDVQPGVSPAETGHLRKTVRVHTAAARGLSAETLDVVTERLEGKPFDLIVATNLLPYFDDAELMLAMSNVAAMLAPGGIFLHNEPRPLLGDVTDALGLPFEQSRHVVIASVGGAPAPLSDSIWLHRKIRN
jgi:hypothetical protein